MSSPLPDTREVRRWLRGLHWVLAVLLMTALSAPAAALASASVKVVRYHGASVRVPASWPVYDLARHPTACVRFNRHAVYLGTPGATQSCPPHVVGRTEAILMQPVADHATNAAAGTVALPSTSSARADANAGSLAREVDSAHGVLITATWNHGVAVIETAFGVHSLTALAAGSHTMPAPLATTPHLASPRTSGAGAVPGGVYTGYGFDACSAPSSSTMSAWRSASPFGAIGVYIGGANIGCSQPNLTASWVSTQSATGWHLLPIYVGLQAPSNICGCAGVSASYATSQGTAAAQDAVAHAKSLGMGAGNPIYDDMEAYSRTATNSAAVEAFLSAWTAELHALGYKSGVYSSDSSGIADLVSRYGTSFHEPDDLWIAAWNGIQSTADYYVPSTEWAGHQRVHQYNGGWNGTYGGVTMNIDGDWLDAATGAAGSVASVASPPPVQPPMATAAPTITGTAAVGQTLTEHRATWSHSPSAYSVAWQDCNASGASCTTISGASGQTYVVRSGDIGHTIRAVETATNAGGHGTSASAVTVSVPVPPVSAYWLYTAQGNVIEVGGKAWYGSPFASKVTTSSIVGMAVTADERGYWLASSTGRVYAYGDAHVASTTMTPSHPVIGIVAAPGGGYYLFTAAGNVYNAGAATWYGSPWAKGTGTTSIVGMTVTRDGRGYWLVTATGTVYAYGDAKVETALATSHPIKGIVASSTRGFWEYNVFGNVPYSPDTAWYGSPAGSLHVSTTSVTGMSATPDAHGYWVVTAAGQVYGFGDAAAGPTVTPAHPVIGIVG